MDRLYIIVVTTFIFALSGAAPALSQAADASGKSAEELQKMFEQQKTRGLVIAPSSSGDAAASGQTTTTSVSVPEVAEQYTDVGAGNQVDVRISFDFDSALLREDQKPKLTTLCEAIQNMEGQVFRIVGHTDSAGSASYNEKLSLLRAKEVKRYMVNSCGIAENRLLAIGAGEGHPINAADPRADENRRVEFQLIS